MRMVCLGVMVAAAVGCGGRATNTLPHDDPGVDGDGVPAGGNATGGEDAGSGAGGTGPEPGDSLFDETLLWRQTTVPLCAGSDVRVVDLWSDHRGVYVHSDGWRAESTAFNDGIGWQLVDFPQYRLTGFRGGALVGYGGRSDGSGCTIEFIRNGAVECSGRPARVTHVFTVHDSLAYAIYDDLILRFDGAHWTQLGSALPGTPGAFGAPYALTIWGDEDVVVVAAGDHGLYVSDVSSGEHTLQHAGVDLEHLAVWGGSADDLWSGTRDGQLLHFDGHAWRVAWKAPEDRCSAITGIWGAEDALFFHTSNTIQVVRGGAVATLAEFPCESDTRRVVGVWGNSTSEVFFGIRHPEAACQLQLVWFNGTAFGRL